MKNVNHANHGDINIESSWIWLDRKLDFAGFRGTMLDFVNWTIKASYFTYLRINELERAGKVFDAAFFNHVTPITLLLSFRKRMPTVLSLDSTPILLDNYGAFYKGPSTVRLPKWILKYRYRLTRRAYIDASYILAWSELVRRSLIDDYHIPPEHIAVVPPGVDVERFTPADRGARGPGEKVKVLFVGGEFLRKGGDLLLELAQEERFKNHEFHFITRTFTGDRGPNVFVYDNISSESDLLRTLYASADLFVLPTRGDFCPTNTICEAMAAGLPVITTRVGGLEEIVKDRENGMLVDVENKEQLGAAIDELSTDAEMRLCLGANARKWVELKYDLQQRSKEIFVYLTRAANGGRHCTETETVPGKTLMHG